MPIEKTVILQEIELHQDNLTPSSLVVEAR